MDICETRRIGRTDLHIPIFGLGANPLRGQYEPIPFEDVATTVERTGAMKQLCEDHSTSLKAVAIQFPLHHGAVASVLMGRPNPEHVDDNIRAFSEQEPDALWSDFKAAGFIAADAPTPAS